MIHTRDAGPIRIVALDRPERRNALTRAGLDDLREAFSTIDPERTPVAYVHGRGTAFCAGADLDVVSSLEDPAEFAARGQAALNAIEDCEAIVVAGVDGAARGGGVELALAADVRVATPDASFAEPGVTLGLFGAWGGTRRLPAAVGPAHAADLSYSGRTIDAEPALAMGLVSRIVEEPVTVAEEIAGTNHDALRELKGLLGGASSRTRADQEAAERAAFDRLLGNGID